MLLKGRVLVCTVYVANGTSVTRLSHVLFHLKTLFFVPSVLMMILVHGNVQDLRYRVKKLFTAHSAATADGFRPPKGVTTKQPRTGRASRTPLPIHYEGILFSSSDRHFTETLGNFSGATIQLYCACTCVASRVDISCVCPPQCIPCNDPKLT